MKDIMKAGYRHNVVDIHSHILPGVDDGAGNVEESVDLLHVALGQGIRDLIATPHYGLENGYAPDRDMVREKYCRLKEFLFQSGSPIKSLLGTEWYCAEDIVERINRLSAAAHGPHVEKVSLSVGYASHSQHPDADFHELEVIADQMMYQEKQNYYRMPGVDRRRKTVD